MQRLELEVNVRHDRGKSMVRKLRARGSVPAIAYGLGLEALMLSVDAPRLERLVAAGANTLIDLHGHASLEGKLFLLKELQREPVSRDLLHCDFQAVDPTKPIQVSVPLSFEGRPVGVEKGGVLEPLLREVEVSCLPLAIPDRIEVGVTELDIGDAIHIGDLEIPEGVTPLGEASIGVVHVITPRVEVVEVEAVEEAPAEEAAEEQAETPAEAKDEQETER